MNFQVRPPSDDLYMRRPVETLLRTSSDPVPRYITCGSESETATQPVDPRGTLPSVIATHEEPPSVVLNNPPLATPMKKVLGCEGTPVTVVTRPPREGPTNR